MKRKLLIVDDDESFAECLKGHLDLMSDIFETDISFSVSDAILKIGKKAYDLVITDINFPGKSGIDLLLYLKEIRFPGSLKVITGYDTDENISKIESFGVIDIIRKPIDIPWFLEKLREFFSTPRDEMVTFESIDLLSVMQIINLEKKTSALEIDMEGKKGIIYFEDGEVINGEYENLVGEKAVLKLITLNRGKISVKKSNRKIRRVIKIPFMRYMIEITKTLDELVVFGDKEPVEDDVTETKKYIIISNAIKKVLKSLENVTGYLGAGIFSPDGDLIERITVNRNLYLVTQFENIGVLIRNALKESQNITDELGFGPLKTIQLYGETGIIFLVCQNDEKSQFYTALFIKEDGNITMAKKKLQEVVEALKPELSTI